ncbi:hypothetical protein [Staphylothermus hellenicus]|uniref:4Fe-4S ferredoxin n=1 Tax=Staphylothermus hellenicus (strain DSM 12710 / JCM 10830 / BK20S6-10-b1 / P8) TaxID=591019 RepID=D7DC35_STAHD|nr:hypothetical protein [Staphylothermus hellenicus]ADI31732.1 hypothetical protein Shell_0607 [Staphylothermus hellenicus DSM 12710]
MYRIPRLIDVNAKSRIFRDKKKLLIIGRCVELEHPEILEKFKNDYALLSVCLEAEHVNMVGFKLAGILARGKYEEVSVLTVDGSLHCTQLHWMVEEVFKILGGNSIKRRHFVIYHGKLYEVSVKAVKTSRYLYKVHKLVAEG